MWASGRSILFNPGKPLECAWRLALHLNLRVIPGLLLAFSAPAFANDIVGSTQVAITHTQPSTSEELGKAKNSNEPCAKPYEPKGLCAADRPNCIEDAFKDFSLNSMAMQEWLGLSESARANSSIRNKLTNSHQIVVSYLKAGDPLSCLPDRGSDLPDVCTLLNWMSLYRTPSGLEFRRPGTDVVFRKLTSSSGHMTTGWDIYHPGGKIPVGKINRSPKDIDNRLAGGEASSVTFMIHGTQADYGEYYGRDISETSLSIRQRTLDFSSLGLSKTGGVCGGTSNNPFNVLKASREHDASLASLPDPDKVGQQVVGQAALEGLGKGVYNVQDALKAIPEGVHGMWMLGNNTQVPVEAGTEGAVPCKDPKYAGKSCKGMRDLLKGSVGNAFERSASECANELSASAKGKPAEWLAVEILWCQRRKLGEALGEAVYNKIETCMSNADEASRCFAQIGVIAGTSAVAGGAAIGISSKAVTSANALRGLARSGTISYNTARGLMKANRFAAVAGIGVADVTLNQLPTDPKQIAKMRLDLASLKAGFLKSGDRASVAAVENTEAALKAQEAKLASGAAGAANVSADAAKQAESALFVPAVKELPPPYSMAMKDVRSSAERITQMKDWAAVDPDGAQRFVNELLAGKDGATKAQGALWQKELGPVIASERKIQTGNVLNHETWKASDTRVARYKQVDHVPAEVRSQADLDRYAGQQLSKRVTAEGKQVAVPTTNLAGEPVYRYIRDEADAKAFAESLEKKGVAHEDLYPKGKLVFQQGKVYEDIKAQSFDQMIGRNNQGLNDATTRYSDRSVARELSANAKTAAEQVDDTRRRVEKLASDLHDDWLKRPENSWVSGDATNSQNRPFAQLGAEDKIKDLDPIENAYKARRMDLAPDTREAYDRAFADLRNSYQGRAMPVQGPGPAASTNVTAASFNARKPQGARVERQVASYRDVAGQALHEDWKATSRAPVDVNGNLVKNADGSPAKVDAQGRAMVRQADGSTQQHPVALKRNSDGTVHREPREKTSKVDGKTYDIANDWKGLPDDLKDLSAKAVRTDVEIVLNKNIPAELEPALVHNQWVADNAWRLDGAQKSLAEAKAANAPAAKIAALQRELDELKVQLGPYEKLPPLEQQKDIDRLVKVRRDLTAQGIDASKGGQKFPVVKPVYASSPELTSKHVQDASRKLEAARTFLASAEKRGAGPKAQAEARKMIRQREAEFKAAKQADLNARAAERGIKPVVQSFPDAQRGRPQQLVEGLSKPEDVEFLARGYADGRSIHTFSGNSGTKFETPQAVEDDIFKKLMQLDPKKDVVLGGGNDDGGINKLLMNALDRARKAGKDFDSVGIVSSKAGAHDPAATGAFKMVFQVQDETWGGFKSPTSKAIASLTDNSHIYGGGPITGEEALMALARNKDLKIDYVDVQASREAISARKVKGWRKELKAQGAPDSDTRPIPENLQPRALDSKDLMSDVGGKLQAESGYRRRLLGGAEHDPKLTPDQYRARPRFEGDTEAILSDHGFQEQVTAQIHNAWSEQRAVYSAIDGSKIDLFDSSGVSLGNRVEGDFAVVKTSGGTTKVPLKKNEYGTVMREPRLKDTGVPGVKEDIANVPFEKLSAKNQALSRGYVEDYIDISLNPNISPSEKYAVVHNLWSERNRHRVPELKAEIDQKSALLKAGGQTPEAAAQIQKQISDAQGEMDFLTGQLRSASEQSKNEIAKAKSIISKVQEMVRKKGMPVTEWGIDNSRSVAPNLKISSSQQAKLLEKEMKSSSAGYALLGDTHLLKGATLNGKPIRSFEDALRYVETDPDGIFKSIDQLAGQSEESLRKGGIVMMGDLIDAPSMGAAKLTGPQQLQLLDAVSARLGLIARDRKVPVKIVMGNHDARLYFKDPVSGEKMGGGPAFARIAEIDRKIAGTKDATEIARLQASKPIALNKGEQGFITKMEAIFKKNGLELITKSDREGALVRLEDGSWMEVSHMPRAGDLNIDQTTGAGNLARGGIASKRGFGVGPDGRPISVYASADIHVAGSVESYRPESLTNAAQAYAKDTGQALDAATIDMLVAKGYLDPVKDKTAIVRLGTAGLQATRSGNAPVTATLVGASKTPHMITPAADGVWKLQDDVVDLGYRNANGDIIPDTRAPAAQAAAQQTVAKKLMAASEAPATRNDVLDRRVALARQDAEAFKGQLQAKRASIETTERKIAELKAMAPATQTKATRSQLRELERHLTQEKAEAEKLHLDARKRFSDADYYKVMKHAENPTDKFRKPTDLVREPSMTEAQLGSVQEYIGGGPDPGIYKKMKDYLRRTADAVRGGRRGLSAEQGMVIGIDAKTAQRIRTIADDVYDVVSKSDEVPPGTYYHGFAEDPTRLGSFEVGKLNLRPGDTFIEPSVLSTSTAPAASKQFAMNKGANTSSNTQGFFAIRVREGGPSFKAIPVPNVKDGSFKINPPFENQFELITMGTELKVTERVVTKDGRVIIYLEPTGRRYKPYAAPLSGAASGVVPSSRGVPQAVGQDAARREREAVQQ